jgi:hypothetical protein
VLLPAQVGIVALAIAWAEIIKTFGFTGFYEALLQQKDDRTRCHETAALVFVVCGALLPLPFLAILWATSLSILGVGQHFWLLALIGLRIPMDLAALQPQARLAQELAYRQLGMRSIIANLLAGAAGVAIAFLEDPLVGLVVYQVGQSALVMVVTLAGRTAARPRARRDCFRRMVHEAVMATTVRIVAVSNNQADQVIVAGLLAAAKWPITILASVWKRRLPPCPVRSPPSFSASVCQQGDGHARSRLPPRPGVPDNDLRSGGGGFHGPSRRGHPIGVRGTMAAGRAAREHLGDQWFLARPGRGAWIADVCFRPKSNPSRDQRLVVAIRNRRHRDYGTDRTYLVRWHDDFKDGRRACLCSATIRTRPWF